MRWNRAPGARRRSGRRISFGLKRPRTTGTARLMRQQAKYQRQCSPLRHLGQGEVDTIAGFSWSLDGTIHVILVERLAVTYRNPGCDRTAAGCSQRRQELAEVSLPAERRGAGGHPVPHENDVRRAVQAGLEITREVARLSEQAERRFGIRCADRGAPCGWRIWTPPKMTCTGWPPTRPRGYLVSHRGRPLIEAAEREGVTGKWCRSGLSRRRRRCGEVLEGQRPRARGASAHGMGPADGLRQPLLLLPVGSRLGWGVLEDQRLETFLRSG